MRAIGISALVGERLIGLVWSEEHGLYSTEPDRYVPVEAIGYTAVRTWARAVQRGAIDRGPSWPVGLRGCGR